METFDRPSECTIVHLEGMKRALETLIWAEPEEVERVFMLNGYEKPSQGEKNRTSASLGVDYQEYHTPYHEEGHEYAWRVCNRFCDQFSPRKLFIHAQDELTQLTLVYRFLKDLEDQLQ